MPAPTSNPTWDSNGTNVTPTTGSRATDGFPLSAQPTSGELNYWMNLVYRWIAWFARETATPVAAAAFQEVEPRPGDPAHENVHFYGDVFERDPAGGTDIPWKVAASLPVDVDRRVTTIDWTYQSAISTNTYTYELRRRPVTGGADELVAGATDPTFGDYPDYVTSVLAVDHVVEAGYHYRVVLTCDPGAGDVPLEFLGAVVRHTPS